GEYLDRLDGTLAVNAGFLVGHSALRRVAMGERSHEPAADDDVDAMRRMLGESLGAGGLGFSSSQAPPPNDGADGPPRARPPPGTAPDVLPPVGPFPEEHLALMAAMSAAGARPLNWNVLVVGAGTDTYKEQLAASDRAAERGGRVLALTVPSVMQLHLNFRSRVLFDALPGLGPPIAVPDHQELRAVVAP